MPRVYLVQAINPRYEQSSVVGISSSLREAARIFAEVEDKFAYEYTSVEIIRYELDSINHFTQKCEWWRKIGPDATPWCSWQGEFDATDWVEEMAREDGENVPE